MRSHGVFAVVTLLHCIHSTYEFVYTEDFCDGVRCPYVTEENCNGYIVKSGSSGGCCDGCVQYLNEGDNCTETNCTAPECATQTADVLNIRGVKRYTAVCKPPNECIGGKCTEPPQSSQQPGRRQKPLQDYEYHGYGQKYPQHSQQPGRIQKPLQDYEYYCYEQEYPQPSEHQDYEQKPLQDYEYHGYGQKYPQPSEHQDYEQKPTQGYEQPSCRHTPPQIYVQ